MNGTGRLTLVMNVLQSLEETLVEQVKDGHTHVCYDGTNSKIVPKRFLLITNVSVKRKFTVTQLHTNNAPSDGPSLGAAQTSRTDIKTYLCVFS